MKIADIHAHIFPEKLAEKASHSIGDFYGVSIEREANMHCLTAEDRLAGVTRCVVSNSATSAKQVFNANTFLAEAVRGHAGYLAFGTIYPGMDGYEEELDRMLELGLRGIKIHPDFQKLAIDDERGIETYKAIARRDLPVLFHMGDDRYDFSSPERLTNLLRRVPELGRVLLPLHMLRHGENVFLDDYTVERLSAELNCPVQIVGIDGGDLLDAMLEREG